jgi:DNA polymerase
MSLSIEERILQLVKLQDPQNPLAYVQDIVRDFAVEKLALTMDADEECVPKDEMRSKMHGNVRAPIMVISDKPTRKQLENGYTTPLEGTEGLDMINKLWDHFEIADDKLFYMNAVNFAPFKEADGKKLDRIPSKTEIDANNPFLFHAIDIVKPKVILLLGPIVSNIFKQEAFSKVRGEWITARGIPAMPTYHPNTLLDYEGKLDQDSLQDKKDEFVYDVENVVNYLKENHPDVV